MLRHLVLGENRIVPVGVGQSGSRHIGETFDALGTSFKCVLSIQLSMHTGRSLFPIMHLIFFHRTCLAICKPCANYAGLGLSPLVSTAACLRTAFTSVIPVTSK